MTFWLVVNDLGRREDNMEYCLVYASDRKDAKRQAFPHLGANKDQYEVTPLVPKEYQFRGINFNNVLIHHTP